MKQISILTLSTLILLSVSSLFAGEIVETNEVIIKIPKVPEVPKVEAIVPTVITVDSDGNPLSYTSLEDIYPSKKKHVFSDHVAPPKFSKKALSKLKTTF